MTGKYGIVLEQYIDSIWVRLGIHGKFSTEEIAKEQLEMLGRIFEELNRTILTLTMNDKNLVIFNIEHGPIRGKVVYIGDEELKLSAEALAELHESYDDSVEDWELLGLDSDTPQDEIDRHWDNQM